MPLIGPKKKPQDFGMGWSDYHLVVNDQAETAVIFRGDGTKIISMPALARGQGKDTEWNQRFTDTPPGLYQAGKVYRDYEKPIRPGDRVLMAYGWYSIDLIDLEGQEAGNGRSGIMIHGGGSALGWPRCWDPYQPLLPTLGCIRMRNADLRDMVVPCLDRERELFVSVYQEAPHA